jgi:hypothetical protein
MEHRVLLFERAPGRLAFGMGSSVKLSGEVEIFKTFIQR